MKMAGLDDLPDQPCGAESEAVRVRCAALLVRWRQAYFYPQTVGVEFS